MFLTIDDVSYTYNAGMAFAKRALNNVSLSIENGAFIGLIGHTGSGKSTLIQQMNGLLKPDSGRVLIDGVDIHADKTKLASIRARVGLVFQYPEYQIFDETIAKDVSFGPKNLKLSKDEIDERVKEALSLVGIGGDMFGKSPFDLSGGQKRRVAIAGVLAMRPDCLILDEPAAGLDPKGRDDILDCIAHMRRERGISIVLVSHNMEEVARYADRIYVMNEGSIFAEGTPNDVFSQYKRLETIGLKAPEPLYLMEQLRAMGLYDGEHIFSAADAVTAIAHILKKGKQ